MEADWRARLVSEAIRAFSTDLNLAVAIVTPRREAKTTTTVSWGTPPKFVVGPLPAGRRLPTS